MIAGEASNGKEALDLIPALKPHIILCDIAMPVMNGLDFIKIVNREYPDIKLVVLSSYDNFEYVREALVNGAVDYVLKPTLNPEELLKIVSRAAKKVPDLELKRKAASSADDILETYLTQENGVHAEACFRDYFPIAVTGCFCFRSVIGMVTVLICHRSFMRK
ncbi:MAG: response regulator [Blautia marasmi]